jgi:hypothetical protein
MVPVSLPIAAGYLVPVEIESHDDIIETVARLRAAGTRRR